VNAQNLCPRRFLNWTLVEILFNTEIIFEI